MDIERAEATGFESSIIESWSGWDGDGFEMWQFYDAKLKPHIQVPGLPDMDTIECVTFLMEKSVVQFYFQRERYIEMPFRVEI